MKTKVNRSVPITVCALLGLALGAMSCASTDMSSTWTDPSAKGASLSKVAVVCLTKDPGLRRTCEDTAAAHLTGAQAVPSYQALGDISLKNRDAVKERLTSLGFQGVLIMRMTGVTEQVTAFDGPYGTFDGYYDWAGATMYNPGYLETDTVVHVVSNLYELNGQNKLIWSGVSETFDPSSAKSFMNDVSKAVAKSVEKDHLVL